MTCSDRSPSEEEPEEEEEMGDRTSSLSTIISWHGVFIRRNSQNYVPIIVEGILSVWGL